MKSSKISGGEKREIEREKNEKLTFSKKEKREVEGEGEREGDYSTWNPIKTHGEKNEKLKVIF